MKVESPATPSRTNASPSASPNPNTSRAAFSRPGAHVPQAINDGRRLYVGNMPYTAKMEDVEALFIAAEFPMYAYTWTWWPSCESPTELPKIASA